MARNLSSRLIKPCSFVDVSFTKTLDEFRLDILSCDTKRLLAVEYKITIYFKLSIFIYIFCYICERNCI